MEGIVVNQLCRIVVGISCQIGQDGHRDMGDVSTYGKWFETSSVRWNLQVRIFVQIHGDKSISEDLREWQRKKTCIE